MEGAIGTEGIVAEFGFEGPGEAVGFDGLEHLGEEGLDLLVFLGGERITMLTIVPVAIDEIEPAMTFVEVKDALFVCQVK